MKKIIILLLAITCISCNSTKTTSQTKQSSILDTEKYTGVYFYGDDIEKGATGYITLFAETDSTVLFHISLNRGPKSYNSGELYERITLEDGKGTFQFTEYTYQEKSCKWDVSIKNDTLIISTIDDNYNCGFGHNVFADGTYTRKNKTKPEFFEDRLGSKTYFSKTSPEEYYKE